jgi:hypothetical protein
MDIEKEFSRLAENFGEDIAEIKERFSKAQAEIEATLGHKAKADKEQDAYNMVLAQLQRKYNTKIKIFDGIFLACDGRVNDIAKRKYEFLKSEALKMEKKDAIASGLINEKGKPIWPMESKYQAGKQIDPEDVFFTIHGIVVEGNKMTPMTFRISNIELLEAVVLNKPVRFHASKGLYQTSGRMSLRSEPTTRFEYTESPESNLAYRAARGRFSPDMPPKGLLDLWKMVKEKDGSEKMVLDRRFWLLQDVVISGIYKQRKDNQMYVDITHPDLLGWDIVVVYPMMKTDYELVRDRKADIYACMYQVSPEEKRIVMFGAGYWQDSEFRPKGAIPTPEVSGSTVTMKFKD